ncbi:uncharacterized protein METZ01_LOCUS10321 [marine metagenome]|uniref:Uncharacterized protein n=1 Tax=marine metagenome TaxID=408172 RepID=A0A381NSH8_9ZZZZ
MKKQRKQIIIFNLYKDSFIFQEFIVWIKLGIIV